VSPLAERHALRSGRPDRADLRRLRRELRDRDRLGARLAELYRIDALLDEAARFVRRGWLQHGWFAYVDAKGEYRIVTACTRRATRTVAAEQMVNACLVGALIHAAGGPSEARSQLVQRTIDLTWHTMFRRQDEPIRWCPSPVERAGHVVDLVRWNDRPGRTPDEVAELLCRARALGRTEAERARASQLPA